MSIKSIISVIKNIFLTTNGSCFVHENKTNIYPKAGTETVTNIHTKVITLTFMFNYV